MQTASVEDDEAAFLDLLRNHIVDGGGKIKDGRLGQVPKPTSLKERPFTIIRRYPDRFKISYDASGLWLSLANGGEQENSETDLRVCSPVPYNYVQTFEALSHAIEKLIVAEHALTPDGKAIIAVDLEGDSTVETIQVAYQGAVVIVDCRLIGKDAVAAHMQQILSSKDYIKLFHDVRQDATLLNECGLSLEGVLDTQLVAEAGFGHPFIGLNPFLKRINLPTNTEKKKMSYQMNVESRDPFKSRPFKHEDLLYAAYDVSCLLPAKEYIWSKFRPLGIEKLLQASSLRISDSLTHGTRRSFCFDKTHNYRLSSSEIFRLLSEEKAYFGNPTSVVTNIDDIVDLLPGDMGETLRTNEYLGRNVSDISLDLGRKPVCMLPEERRELCAREVTSDDIKQIISNLEGRFGRDGRAAMPKSLNRISAIRGKDSEIIGITFRMGRTIHNRSDLLLDFLLGTDKSVLILGRPASGKTSVIRDIARVLSETQNVVVVDKSNEIAGDGTLPHESINKSRRMMVPRGKSQQDVMIECVENHAPQVMVIDEIGNQKQVIAARTAKDRGVRMIATAHGDLCGLIDNPVLNGLIGGVDTVPITDAEAAIEQDRRVQLQNASQGGFVCERRQSPPKLKTQRLGQPIFDVIVEVWASNRNSMKVIPDTGRAVDEVLAGMPYFAHVRSKDPETSSMFYEFADDFCVRTSVQDPQEMGIDLEEDEV